MNTISVVENIMEVNTVNKCVNRPVPRLGSFLGSPTVPKGMRRLINRQKHQKLAKAMTVLLKGSTVVNTTVMTPNTVMDRAAYGAARLFVS